MLNRERNPQEDSVAQTAAVTGGHKTDTRHIRGAHKTAEESVLTKTESNLDSMAEGGKGSTRGHLPSGAAYATKAR
eukprot:scaffold3352_cov130-Isochrysis_galbana.AAC.3